jgi:hypothetical protein
MLGETKINGPWCRRMPLLAIADKMHSTLIIIHTEINVYHYASSRLVSGFACRIHHDEKCQWL